MKIIMKEKEIKEMLGGIINNNEKWECRPIKKAGYINITGYKWRPFILGDKINDNWEYRKCELFHVYRHKKDGYITAQTLDVGYLFNCIPSERDEHPIYYFEGTEEECNQWIKNHTKKSWIDEHYPTNKVMRSCITSTCKKILVEASKSGCKDTVSFIKEIIENLGVQL